MRKSIILPAISLAISGLFSIPVYADTEQETISSSEPSVATALPASELPDTVIRKRPAGKFSISPPAGLAPGYGTTTFGTGLEINALNLDFRRNSEPGNAAEIYPGLRTDSKPLLEPEADIDSQSISARLSQSASPDKQSGFRLFDQAEINVDPILTEKVITGMSVNLNYVF